MGQSSDRRTNSGFRRAAARRSRDYWLSKSQSRIQPVLFGSLSIAGLFSLSYCQVWARRAGMPAMPRGLVFWFWLPVSLLLNITIHELGHAIVAWSQYYRVRVIVMGPITFWRDSSGLHSRFDWRRLFYSDGFTGSIATRQDNARGKHVAVIAAGPVVSLLGGFVFACIAVLAKGSSWQAWWWVFAVNAMMGFVITIVNLIPVGCSDGSMLLHLIRWNVPGRLLIAQQLAASDEEQAKERHDEADFAGEIEIKRAMLSEAERAGDANSMAIAGCHQSLGYALYSAGDAPAAEQEMSRALAFETELAANPSLAANVWSGLVAIRSRRQLLVELRQAYSAAVEIIQQQKEHRDPVHRGMTCAMLAQVHVQAGNWEQAAVEAADGLKYLPLRPEYLNLYANLFVFQAEAHLRVGRLDTGLTAASNAAETLRAEVMPYRQRNLAANDLGKLGEALWRAGQPASAIEYLRESIAALEQSGLSSIATAYRIQLCGILRTLGRFSEAVKSLPPESGLPVHLRRNLLAETIELAILAEAGPVALEHSQTLLQLWQAEAAECAPEIAIATSLMGRAYLAAGKLDEAGENARSAFEVLEHSGHPEAARCLLIIATAHHAATGVWASGTLEQARRLIEAAVLLPAAEKCRWQEFARPEGEHRDVLAAGH